MVIARLEGDRYGPPPWQNQNLPQDANKDGVVTSNDALPLSTNSTAMVGASPSLSQRRVERRLPGRNGEGPHQRT